MSQLLTASVVIMATFAKCSSRSRQTLVVTPSLRDVAP